MPLLKATSTQSSERGNRIKKVINMGLLKVNNVPNDLKGVFITPFSLSRYFVVKFSHLFVCKREVTYNVIVAFAT